MQRRHVLVGVAGGLAALAGCSEGSGDGTDGSAGETGGSGGSGSGSGSETGETDGSDEAGGSDGGDTGGSDGDDATQTATPTPTEAPTVPGSESSEKWTAESLGGTIDADANSITVRGTMRNTADTAQIPYSVYLNYFDASGAKLMSSSHQLEDEDPVAGTETFDYEITVAFEKIEATNIDEFESFVNSREGSQ